MSIRIVLVLMKKEAKRIEFSMFIIFSPTFIADMTFQITFWVITIESVVFSLISLTQI